MGVLFSFSPEPMHIRSNESTRLFLGGEQNCQTLTGALSEDLGVEEKAVFFFPDHCLSAFLISEEVKVPPMVGLCTL